MERYIDAAALLKRVKSKSLIFEESTPVEEAIAEQVSVFEEAIEEAPTADVVPKREVEALIKENERWMTEYAGFRAGVESIVENAKQEVAREIFEEIEQFIFGYGTANLTVMPTKDFIKLKKKYTEEKTDENISN